MVCCDDLWIMLIGGWLCNFCFDELFQFVNVLGGLMSFVGFRFECLGFVVQYFEEVLGYVGCFVVQLGFIGFVQVNGDYDLSFENKLCYDFVYFVNWSIWFDVMILLCMVKIVLMLWGIQV